VIQKLINIIHEHIVDINHMHTPLKPVIHPNIKSLGVFDFSPRGERG
jgi:hypothetical protein